MGDVILMSDLPIKQPEKVKIQDLIKNNRRLYEVLPNNSWKDRRCFIIGGGPSLENFDFSILKGELTIGINRAFEKFDPTILFSMDSRFWGWVERGQLGEEAKRKFREYKGFKVWLNVIKFPYPEDIYIVDSAGQRELTFSMKAGIGHGNNSGYAAVNLAICLGANPIYLLGFDMKGEKDKQKWWHNGYPQIQQGNVYRSFKANFNWAAPKIKESGFRVVNLNPESALECFEFGKIKDIEKIRKPVIVSFYTEKTGYEKEVKRLMLSIKKFGLEYDIRPIPNLGGWLQNTHHKAVFIKEMLERYQGRPILWMDADVVLHSYPVLFDNLDADIAVCYIDWTRYNTCSRNDKELNSSVLYISNNELTRRLIDEWVQESRKNINSRLWDQTILQNLLDGEWKDKLKVKYLPGSYCQIYDLMAAEGDPVIELFQASRRFKKSVEVKIKGGAVPGEYDLSKGMAKELLRHFGPNALTWSMLGYDGEEKFIELLKRIKPRTVIEIGTFQGVSAVLLARYSEKVITFDIKEMPLKYKIWEYFGVADKIETFIIKDNEELNSKLKNLDFDLAFIDGCHDYKSVKDNFGSVKKCGRVIFHDYKPKSIHRDRTVKFVDSLGEKVEKIMPFAYWCEK